VAAGILPAPPPEVAAAPPPQLGAAEDIAYAVVYLASNESRHVNGQRLVIGNSLAVTPGSVPG
jgi:NAD(P)-dependent dehydrogenase (short-subunit alcohol dehydrogenase family)